MRKPRAEPPYEADQDVPESGQIPHGGGGGAHHHQQLIDPHAPLPGAIKIVSDQRPPRRGRGVAESDRAKYALYLEELVRTGGDVASALATALNIPLEEAHEKRAELHAEMLEKGMGRSVSKVLRESDLNAEGRIAVLRSLVYSGVPAAQLRAIDLLSEMDQGRGEDENASYEAFVRSLYARTT